MCLVGSNSGVLGVMCLWFILRLEHDLLLSIMTSSSTITCLCIFLFFLLFACSLHAGHYADKVLIVVTGLSCTLSASDRHCLELPSCFLVLMWPQRLGNTIAFKRGEFLNLSYNFFSLCLLLSVSLFCLFFFGNYFEREKCFWGWMRGEGLLRQGEKELYWCCEHCPFCSHHSPTTFLHNVGITGVGENYAAKRMPLFVIF